MKSRWFRFSRWPFLARSDPVAIRSGSPVAMRARCDRVIWMFMCFGPPERKERWKRSPEIAMGQMSSDGDPLWSEWVQTLFIELVNLTVWNEFIKMCILDHDICVESYQTIHFINELTNNRENLNTGNQSKFPMKIMGVSCFICPNKTNQLNIQILSAELSRRDQKVRDRSNVRKRWVWWIRLWGLNH